MIVMGVDPGLAALGWAVIERKGQRVSLLAHGCLATAPADGSDLDRVGMLARDLGALIVGAPARKPHSSAWPSTPTVSRAASGAPTGYHRTTSPSSTEHVARSG